MEVLEDVAALADLLVVERCDGFAFARDLGGHALRELRDGLLVDEQVHLRLTEHIDEAGRDDEAGGVDGALRRGALGRAPDERDLVALNADVSVDPRVTAAIDDAAVADDDIVLLGKGGRREEQDECESLHRGVEG